ncbi:MAG TPA: carbohydrate kinase family protein [Terriglobales bacterium]|nr:carbohydrate kinase family protein [Terriglobales bacterium]
MKNQTEVVGLGSCGVDFFAIVPKLIGADEKVNATHLEIHAGGVTGNNLTQIARLGATAGWIGFIGNDDNGRIIQHEFEADGMDLSGIEVCPGELSTMTWIPVDAQGERCIYMFPNVTAKITPKDIRSRFARHIQQAKHFHTEASQLPLPPVLEAIKVARESNVKVIFDLDVDPAYFVRAGLGTEEGLKETLRLTDVLKPCKAAAKELTGESDYERIARKLLDMGPKLVAITMGSEGCLIATAENITHVPSFLVKVVDTTGAGDAFMGGLSYGLLQGWDHGRVGVFANACAALCCTRVGARAMSNLAQVNELISQQQSTQAKGV